MPFSHDFYALCMPYLRFVVSLATLSSCLISAYEPCYAITVHTGIIAVEEGDDRYGAGSHIHIRWPDFYTDFYTYGHAFRVFKQQTYLLTLGRQFAIPQCSWIQLAVGGVGMVKSTEIVYDSALTQDLRGTVNNLGVQLGVDAFYHPWQKGLLLTCGWHALLFPAGFSGALFLATGRIHILKAGLGYSW